MVSTSTNTTAFLDEMDPSVCQIDMTTSDGKNIFRLATKDLDTKYDLGPDESKYFYDQAEEAV